MPLIGAFVSTFSFFAFTSPLLVSRLSSRFIVLLLSSSGWYTVEPANAPTRRWWILTIKFVLKKKYSKQSDYYVCKNFESSASYTKRQTYSSKTQYSTMSTNSSPPGNCKFAIPKKGRLFEKVAELLEGAGIEYRREPRLDVALCKDLPITLIFLPAADIAKYVGEGNVDIGITGIDVVEESNVEVERVMELGFGKCKLCVQAPVANNITDPAQLSGGRIVTSFPYLTQKYFKAFDDAKGVTTKVTEVSGSVEAACGLGLADAVVDLVETGTTMRVSSSIFKIVF